MVKTINSKAPELLDLIRLDKLNVAEASKLASLPVRDRAKLLRLANGHPLNRATVKSLTTQVRNEARVCSAKRHAKRIHADDNQNVLTGDMQILWEHLDELSVDMRNAPQENSRKADTQ